MTGDRFHQTGSTLTEYTDVNVDYHENATIIDMYMIDMSEYSFNLCQ